MLGSNIIISHVERRTGNDALAQSYSTNHAMAPSQSISVGSELAKLTSDTPPSCTDHVPNPCDCHGPVRGSFSQGARKGHQADHRAACHRAEGMSPPATVLGNSLPVGKQPESMATGSALADNWAACCNAPCTHVLLDS